MADLDAFGFPRRPRSIHHVGQVLGCRARGQLFRGPPLAGLSARACTEAARLSIRTVIDLRTDDERLARPNDGCIGATFVSAVVSLSVSYVAMLHIGPVGAAIGIVVGEVLYCGAVLVLVLHEVRKNDTPAGPVPHGVTESGSQQ